MKRKYLSFMANKFFDFPGEVFLFSKFHEDEVKHGKRNFKRDLTVAFKVKNS